MPSTAIQQVRVPGDAYDAHLTVPETPNGAGVMLLQEIFGVNDFLLGKAGDLAGLGYTVLCPDVFWRVERNVALPHDEAALGRAFGYMERFMSVDPATTASDLLASLAHLREAPTVTGSCAVMGYCLGGRLAYEAAVAGTPDACVSYYGSGIADRLEAAGEVACPVLFHFGGEDQFIPNDQVDAIRKAFEGRPDVEVHVQPEAGHAFENLHAPAFANADAAAKSWPITAAFLQRTLLRD